MADYHDEIYKKLRFLGPLEQYSAARGHLGIYNNVCVAAFYKCRPGWNLRDKLLEAIGRVLDQHLILSAAIVDVQTESPRFVQLPEVDPAEVVTLRESAGSASETSLEEELRVILEEQHNTPFSHEMPLRPLWRLEALDDRANTNNLVVCFCFHHSLMDTRSAVVFLKDLSKTLNTLPEGSAADQPGLLPCMESIYELPLSEAFIQKASSPTEPPDNVWSGAPQRLPVKTKLRLFWVPASVGDALRSRAREEWTSVTAVLMALLAATSFKVLPRKYDTVQADCAMSLRHHMPLPINDRSMGCFIGSCSETYTRDYGSIWVDARRTKRTIEEALASNGQDMPFGYLQCVRKNMSSWLMAKMGKKRASAWELSNVGVFGPRESARRQTDTLTYLTYPGGRIVTIEPDPRLVTVEPWNLGLFTMERMLFSQSASASSAAVKVSVVTGRDQQLGFSFSWQDGVVEEDLAERLVSTFRELLESTAESTG